MAHRLFWFFRVAIVFLFVATQPIGAQIHFPPDLDSEATSDPGLMSPASHSAFDQRPLNSSDTDPLLFLPAGSFAEPQTPFSVPMSGQAPTPALLYTNFNGGGVSGGGTPAFFTLTNSAMVTSIVNYHYGHSCPPGATISLQGPGGIVYGPWPAVAAVAPGWGSGAWYWGVLPNVSLPPGQYTVYDSHPQSWSRNGLTQGRGMTLIMGVAVSEPSITSVAATPATLWLDETGAGSGIVFRATADGATTVSFKIITPSGLAMQIGSKHTVPSGGEHVAKMSWWGSPNLVAGTYTIIAASGISSKQASFTVRKIDQMVVGLGTWMEHSKDPGVKIPPRPEVHFCPTRTWEELINEKEGFTTGLVLSDPVNIVSGNFVVPEEDLSIRSRLPLVMARIYNSLDPHVGAFGRGWSSPFLARLEFQDSAVVFVNSDGSRVLFSKTGTTYQAPGWSDLRLAFDANTDFWSVSHPNGSEWTFNNGGKIIRMARGCCGRGATDALTFAYDSNDRLAAVNNPFGQRITFSTDSNARIVTAADSTGRTLHYSYDDNGNLVGYRDALGRSTRYEYDEDGFMTSLTRPGNRTTQISYVDRRASVVTSPAGSRFQFALDDVSHKVSFTDGNGAVHEYGFTPDWRLSSYAVPALGVLKRFSFTQSALTGYTNALGHASTYAYGIEGLLQTMTDVSGNATHYEWHQTFHTLTRKTDALGRFWQYDWCPRGNLITEIDPAGGETRFTYDAHNNRTSRIDPLGRVQRWVYDGAGNHLMQRSTRRAAFRASPTTIGATWLCLPIRLGARPRFRMIC
jgi:YD repeat-containing protein